MTAQLIDEAWAPPARNIWVDEQAAKTLGITPRLCDVLCGLANGWTTEHIGKHLFLTPNTVKTHVKRLCKALGAHDRAHAVAIAYDGGALRTAGERVRHDQVMAAVEVLVRKYEQHKRCGWTSNGRSAIAIGALDELVAAYRGGEA